MYNLAFLLQNRINQWLIITWSIDDVYVLVVSSQASHFIPPHYHNASFFYSSSKIDLQLESSCGPIHFPLSPRSGTRLFIRRHTSRRRHQPPSSAFVIVGSTDCPTNTAGDNGRSCVSSCRQQTLEQFTARRHLCSHTSCFLQPSKNISVPALVSHQLDSSFIAV